MNTEKIRRVESNEGEYIYSVGTCNCGQEVILVEFTNECVCGLLYNSQGQELAPRDQWEEAETR